MKKIKEFVKKKALQQIVYLSIILASSYGVLDLIGICNGTFNGQQLAYYTILSNTIICCFYIFSFFYNARREEEQKIIVTPFFLNIKGALTLMILVTGLIYHVLLVPNLAATFPDGLNPFSNFLVHTFVPALVLSDWLLFVRVDNIKILFPVRWLSIPLGYWIFSILYSSFRIPFYGTGSFYAYFFIDSNLLGWPKVFLNVLELSAFFLILGYILKFVKFRR